jgi:hypothetical protein
VAKWRALLKASAAHHEITAKTDETLELRSSEGVFGSFGGDSVVAEKRDSDTQPPPTEAAGDGRYAPPRPCSECQLSLWWQRPDGGWVCAVCEHDPVKCRQCDSPHYAHPTWPMVCDCWEPKP